MNISSFAQETMCFVGQQLVFEEAEMVLNSLTGLNGYGTGLTTCTPIPRQVLDFFHAAQHLCEFARDCIADEDIRQRWVEAQREALLEKDPESVIQAIEELSLDSKGAEKERKNLLEYYRDNLERMRYKKFRQQGLYIGSGAIELAHKSVLQERLKLSGQHWTLPGLQKMAQLRVTYKSNRWNKIVEFAKSAA